MNGTTATVGLNRGSRKGATEVAGVAQASVAWEAVLGWSRSATGGGALRRLLASRQPAQPERRQRWVERTRSAGSKLARAGHGVDVARRERRLSRWRPLHKVTDEEEAEDAAAAANGRRERQSADSARLAVYLTSLENSTRTGDGPETATHVIPSQLR